MYTSVAGDRRDCKGGGGSGAPVPRRWKAGVMGRVSATSVRVVAALAVTLGVAGAAGLSVAPVAGAGPVAHVTSSSGPYTALTPVRVLDTRTGTGAPQGAVPAGGVFTPLSAPPKYGWLHTELYDNNNNFAWSLDLFVLLRITGGMASKEGAILRPQFEANILYSTQNVGLLNNA